jgi:hypothetical protein
MMRMLRMLRMLRMTAGEAVDVGCDAVCRYQKDVSAVSTTYQQDAVEL